MDLEMMRLLLILIWVIFLSSPLRLAAVTPLTVYTITQLHSLQKIESRNVVIFLYTDWCRYCRAMEQTTLKNDSVVKQLNEQFYFVALNAEEKTDIIFQGQKYMYKPTGFNTGVHELGEKLAKVNGQVSYPSICVLDQNGEALVQHPGFLSSTGLLEILSAVIVE
jgi:thioredoxin-related protein